METRRVEELTEEEDKSDASAQMAILQFSTCGREATAVPTSIHCDHLISAYEGAEADLKVSELFFLNPKSKVSLIQR